MNKSNIKTFGKCDFLVERTALQLQSRVNDRNKLDDLSVGILEYDRIVHVVEVRPESSGDSEFLYIPITHYMRMVLQTFFLH